MKGVIWSCNRDIGVEKLKYIRDRYEWAGVPALGGHFSRQGAWLEFANGDVWRCASASEASRGVRSNIAWIDAGVDKEFLHTVILRTLICPGGSYYEFFH